MPLACFVGLTSMFFPIGSSICDGVASRDVRCLEGEKNPETPGSPNISKFIFDLGPSAEEIFRLQPG